MALLWGTVSESTAGAYVTPLLDGVEPSVSAALHICAR